MSLLKNPYACSVCRKAFSSSKYLLGHVKEHVKFHLQANPLSESSKIDEKLDIEKSSFDLQKRNKCQFCDLSFPTLPKLKVHISIVHTDEYLAAEFDEKEKNDSVYVGKSSKKKSEKKSKRILKRISNDSDFSGKDSEDDLEPPKIDEKSQKTLLKKLFADKSLNCQYCNKKLSTPQTVKIHEKIHTGEKLFSCRHCKKEFRLFQSLKNHERTHTGEKPYSCKICNKAFFSIESRNGHNKIHDKQSLFKCKYCSKTFSYKHHLMNHERVHTGEKPFACSYCNKAFTQSQTVKTHEREHTGERPYSCRNCQKTFKNLSNLKTHEIRKKPCKNSEKKTCK